VRPFVSSCAIAAALSGCGRVDDADGAESATPGQRSIALTVRIPDDSSTRLWAVVLPFDDHAAAQRIALVNRGPGRWTGTVPLDDGAVVRYHYERSDGAGSAEREDTAAAAFEHRLVVVRPELIGIEDVVASWRDHPDPGAPSASLRGSVRDAATGAPVAAAQVCAGGVTATTAADGSFQLDAIAAGAQRVVVTTAGHHRAAQATAGVIAGRTTRLAFAMVAAPDQPVRFDAVLPVDTPAGAEVRLVGEVAAAGDPHRLAVPAPEPLRAPPADRSTPGHARFTVRIREGSHVRYSYALDARSEAMGPPRSFVVTDAADRRDHITAWGSRAVSSAR
jgi:hypothetical protein